MPKERTFNGVSDFEAEWAAELNYWGIQAMQYEIAAAFCARMGRFALLDNPAARRELLTAETTPFHDKFNTELIAESGDFREVPFGILSDGPMENLLARIVRRRELAAQNAELSERENLRRMLEAKSVLGTEEEKTAAFETLAEMDAEDESDIKINDIEA